MKFVNNANFNIAEPEHTYNTHTKFCDDVKKEKFVYNANFNITEHTYNTRIKFCDVKKRVK